MANKSSRMYSQSPTIKRDDEGKTGISKPEPETKENMGLAGGALPGASEEQPIHIKQFKDMHERHLTELKDMQKRHQKEHEKLTADHAGLMGDTTPLPDSQSSDSDS